MSFNKPEPVEVILCAYVVVMCVILAVAGIGMLVL